MSLLHVSLFGRFDARWDDSSLIGLDAGRAQELFCHLLLYRHRPQHREKLADLLWGATSTSQSKRYLRKTLWQLQTALDTDSRSIEGEILLADHNWIQINPDADLWLDIAVFEEAFERAKGLPGKTLDPECVRSFENAIPLYRGDLLEGWYQDWCLFERERFQRMYLIMLDKLMGYCETHSEYETGIVYGNLILAVDRARERTHRRLMRLYYLAHDRTAALRQYRQCVISLKDELGVRPARRTTLLYDAICTDDYRRTAASPTVPSTVETSVLVATLDRLKRLHAAMTDAQHQIERDIQAIDSVLDKTH